MASAVKFDTTKLKQIETRMVTLGGMVLRVGILGAGASTLEAGSSMTLAEIGMLHEFGAPGANIPERSWFRSAIAAHRADIAALHIGTFKKILAGTLEPLAGLELIGLQIVAWIKAGIIAGIAPALAASTIAAKGSSKPLIDHGQLINSITYQVTSAGAAA